MAISAPILRAPDLSVSYTLPHLSEYSISDYYIIAHIETANGLPQRQTINTSPKHKFTLNWAKLSATNVGTLRNAYALMRDNWATFVDMDGATWSVIPDPGQKEVEYTAFSVMQGIPTLYYRSEWKLMQI
jgi:hypothetical protein